MNCVKVWLDLHFFLQVIIKRQWVESEPREFQARTILGQPNPPTSAATPIEQVLWSWCDWLPQWWPVHICWIPSQVKFFTIFSSQSLECNHHISSIDSNHKALPFTTARLGGPTHLWWAPTSCYLMGSLNGGSGYSTSSFSVQPEAAVLRAATAGRVSGDLPFEQQFLLLIWQPSEPCPELEP